MSSDRLSGRTVLWTALDRGKRALAAPALWLTRSLREPIGRRRVLIVVASLLACLYALGVYGYALSVPEIGLRCAFTPAVNKVYDDFLFQEAGNAAGVAVGDTIEQIGGHEVDSWPQVLRAVHDLRAEPTTSVEDLAALDAPGRTHVRYEGRELVRVRLRSQATGATYAVWCRVGRSPVETLLPSVLWFFLKVGVFLVAALVFWNRPADRSAAHFFLLSLVTFGAFIGGYHWWCIVTQPVLVLVFIACSVLLPAVTLHFYLIFPRPKGVLRRHPGWTWAAIYAVPAAFVLLFASGYFRVRWLFRRGSLGDGLDAALGIAANEVYAFLGAATHLETALQLLLGQIYVYLAVAACWYLASLACLLHSYAAAREPIERNQVKWILFGCALALVPMGYSLYLAFLEPSDFGGGAASWPMFLASVCVTAAFTISITRYRLMQLDELISWSVAYFLISFLAGLVYYAVVFVGTVLFSKWIARPSLTQALGVSSAALVVLVVLDWVRGRVQRVLDRRFSRDKSHLEQTLRRMSQAIEQLVDPPTLARRLLQASADLLGVPRGAVYLRDGPAPLFRLADALGPPPPLGELSSGCPLVEALGARGHVALRPRPAGGPGPAQRQLELLGGEVAQALAHEGQLLALLVLGPRRHGAYGPEERNLLTAFAQVTALALAGARGHRTMDLLNRDLREKVAKIAEQQRRILALQSQLRSRAAGRDRRKAGQANGAAAEPAAAERPAGIVGSGPQVRQLLELVRKVSASQSAVLLRGESGTGKELLARALHDHSPRAGKAFVKVHCAALSPGLLESELFGHVKGAFTGAHRDKVGRFELAHGGTLFLDEIGDISLEVQTKLLRVLQELTFERVGSSEPVAVDVRVIAATHQDLEKLILAGRFREDLYYRLNVISIPVPALRERPEDVPELALHFLRVYAQRCGKAVGGIDDDALAVLKGYRWPGNVRQLENVIERAVVVTEGPVVAARDLPPEVLGAAEDAGPFSRPEADQPGKPAFVSGGVRAERVERDRHERERLVRALAAAEGNKAEAARALGLARSTLVSRLRKHGLS